jgi:hypothetical protein
VRLGSAKSAFTHVELEHGADQLYISLSPAMPSSDENGVFAEKHAERVREAASIQNERGSPNPSAMPLRAISLVMGPMRQSRASRQ